MTAIQTIKYGPNKKIIGRTPGSELTELVLLESKQPMSLIEICAKIKEVTGHKYRPAYISVAVRQLLEAGLISARSETAAERKLRFNGAPPRGNMATLYSAPGNKPVPARTEVSVVDGYIVGARKKATPVKRSPQVKLKKTPAREAAPQLTGDLGTILEILIQERTSKLTSEIADLRKKLDAISKITQA